MIQDAQFQSFFVSLLLIDGIWPINNDITQISF